MDSSAMDSVMRMRPSASGLVVSTANSTALSAARTSPFARSAMCAIASGCTSTDRLPYPRSLSEIARLIAVTMSSRESGQNRNRRHRDTMAGVMAIIGFSVVLPMKRITPCSIAGRMLSDCALLQRWHSSSSR